MVSLTPRLVGCAAFSALAATAVAGSKTPAPEKPVEQPLLSFADGKVVFDVQDRLRWEIRENNFDFNDAVRALTDDNWFLNRLRIGVALKPTSWFTIYGQVQDSREWLSDRADMPGVMGAEGDDAFDLSQGYIQIADYKEFPLGVKIGRQVFSFGGERLIGPGEWSNLGRSFDAAKLTYKGESWSLDAFASAVVNVDRGSYNQSDLFNGNENEREQTFSGLYFSTTAIPWQTTDIYLLNLHENYTATGDSDIWTLGTRAKSKAGYFGPFDFDAELAAQSGQVRGLELSSFAAHVGGGYTFEHDWKPRLGIEYNYASGDGDPTDGDIETFQNLFPSNHKFYGYMDAFSWQNIHDLAASFKVQPTKKLIAQLDFHVFWLATTNDSWYRANGTTTVRPLTPAARSASNYAGSELDLTVTWNVCKHLQLQTGYSHFWAGEYLSDTGPSDDADFAYVQATVTF